MGLPVEINPLLISSSGYVVGRSLRFRASASAYLNRTFASAGNQKTWTWSGWVKRGALGSANYTLFSRYVDASNFAHLRFTSTTSDELRWYEAAAGVAVSQRDTTQVLRDPSAWYHIVLAYDTTQAVASDRVKVYLNGNQITAFATTVNRSQNADGLINAAAAHQIGALNAGSFFDGYLAEVNFIDGQALTPSSFGAYDTNGVWQPLKYGGTYGTNGFYLPFSDTTSTTTLCYDKSGNGNNWTPNNISLTAGTTYDSMIDSPTVSASSSNYAMMNPLNSAIPLQFGNLRVISSATNTVGGGATFAFPSGQWYWEATVTLFSGASTNILLGITDAAKSSMITPSVSTPSSAVNFTYGYAYTASSGNIRKYAVDSAYGATFTTGDIIGIAYDATNNTITFYKNGTSQGQVTGLTAGTYIPWVYYGGSSATNTVDMNFGQRPFSYTPPSGYSALNTYNLPTPTIANGALYNAATLWTGTGSSRSISNSVNGASFQPDLVWIKGRSFAYSHLLFDSIRGAGFYLSSNNTNAEATLSGVTSFDADGFSLGVNANANNSGTTYVGWQWKAGGTGSSNTSGSITSTVSVSAQSGFSIVTYTGTGANATVGHGLGVAPSFIIIKNRTDASNWAIYHVSVGNTKALLFDTSSGSTLTAYWNDTSPTSSVYTVGTANITNGSSKSMIAYCWSAVAGYSAFGSYTGNGSADGPFIYTGFRPRWVLLKNTTAASSENWYIYDTTRSTYNVMGQYLYPNATGAENTFTTLDITSNGFKIRTLNSAFNTSSGTYIYAAFAENPFNYSRAR